MTDGATSDRPTITAPVVEVRSLSVRVRDLTLVDDVTFAVGRGERVGLIGESGSGKSLTGLSLLGLLPEDLVATGSVRLTRPDLEVVGAPERALARVRGDDVAMVFQEPMTALNPTMRVGDQVAEALTIHGTVGGREEARRTGGGAARPGAAARSGRGGPGLPAPALRRTATAGRARHRPGQRPRRCWSATSRRRRSTSPCRPRCSTSSCAGSRPATPPCSSSPTTCRSSRPRANGCSSCTAGGSWRPARSTGSSPGPGTATPRACSPPRTSPAVRRDGAGGGA